MTLGCPDTCSGYENFRCICPDGCSGYDSFTLYRDSCHVNTTARHSLEYVTFVLAIFVFLMSTYLMFRNAGIREDKFAWVHQIQRRLTKHEGIETDSTPDDARLSQMYDSSSDDVRRSGRSGPDTGFSGNTSHSGHLARRLRMNINAQHLLSFWLLVFIKVFAICVIIAESALLFGTSSSWEIPGPKRNFLSFLYATATSSLVMSGHIVLYKWYGSLPNIRHYGKLFGINTFLVRHPDALKYIMLSSGFVTVFLVFLFFLILPVCRPNEIYRWNDGGFSTLAVSAILWAIYFTFLSSLLLRVYHEAKKTVLRRKTVGFGSFAGGHGSFASIAIAMPKGRHAANPQHVSSGSSSGTDPDIVLRKEFASIRFTLYGTLIMSIFGVCIAAILLIGSVAIEELRRNLYIAYGMLNIFGELGAVGLMYFVVFRTNPRFRDSSVDASVPSSSPRPSGAGAGTDVGANNV